MDILERLVKQILCDITLAQDEANQLAANLAVKYKDGEVKNLEYFAVPNAVVKSFDFSLKFALESLDKLLNDDALRQIQQIINRNWRRISDRVNSENVTSKDFTALPSEPPQLNFQSVKAGQSDDLVSIIIEEISNAFALALKTAGLNAPEIATQINLLRTDLAHDMPTSLSQLTPNNPVRIPELAAVFDIKKLKGLQTEVLCEVKVKVEVENLNWGFFESENGKAAMLTS